MTIMRSIKSIIWITFCAATLTACGGGGGSGGGKTAPSSHSPDTSSASSPVSSISVSSIDVSSSSISSDVISSASLSSLSVSSSTISLSSASSLSEASSSESSDAGAVITSITVYYKRSAEDYTGWGLHLWGDAIAPATGTTWAAPRPFDRVENGWAIVQVPVVNPAVAFNLIAHKGDFKSPTADLTFVPTTSGAKVWVIQDNNTLFFNEQDAIAAANLIGNASSVLDLSPVERISSDSELPAGWNKSANFMQIFVRSYQDSDGDGHGDFQGLISRLDYLQELGVTGIWLMPMMESSDNDHGYSVIDYRKVESDYGTMADFEALLSEAHARGIGVIIDYVINHSASANPLFIDAASAPTNSKRDWFIFSDTNPGWSSWGGASWHSAANSFYYGAFTSSLPDFNLRNSDVVDYHMDNLRFWLNKGVDGFRFDAAGVLFENGRNAWSDQPENHLLLAQAQAVINSYDNRYMICEAPDAPAQYAVDTSCINSFAFGYQSAIKNTANNRTLNSSLATLLKSVTKETMPLILSNHDSFAGDRPIGELSGNNLGNYKIAAAITTLVSSTPFIYYGEEVGMANGTQSDDGKLRSPMSWTGDTTNAGFTTGTPYRSLSANVSTRNVAAQDGVSGSLLEHYRSLYNLRKNNPLLATGSLDLQSNAGNSHVIFTRTDGNKVAAVFINLSLSAQNLSANTGLNNTEFLQAFPTSDASFTTDAAGSLQVNVPAQSVLVVVHN
jgi:alpha-amylase